MSNFAISISNASTTSASYWTLGATAAYQQFAPEEVRHYQINWRVEGNNVTLYLPGVGWGTKFRIPRGRYASPWRAAWLAVRKAYLG